MKNSVSHFEIYADDLNSLAKFYSSLFDWKIESPPGMDGYLLVRTTDVDAKGLATKPGAINGGMLKRPEKDGPRVINYVNVESVDRAVEKAQSLGAKLKKAKSPVTGLGWYAILADPQGNPFALWQVDTTAK